MAKRSDGAGVIIADSKWIPGMSRVDSWGVRRYQKKEVYSPHKQGCSFFHGVAQFINMVFPVWAGVLLRQ